MSKLSELAKKIPEHIIIEKKLWVGNIGVDIDHVNYDLSKPLNYEKAFETMIKYLGR